VRLNNLRDRYHRGFPGDREVRGHAHHSAVKSEPQGADLMLELPQGDVIQGALLGERRYSAADLPVNGSLVVNPITNLTYALTAYGPGGQTVSSTISVFVR
jgi:hypothetical protein